MSFGINVDQQMFSLCWRNLESTIVMRYWRTVMRYCHEVLRF